jgi:hypothetical protein
MYWRAHKTTALTSIQHTVRGREGEREAEWLDKFQPFLNFGPKCIYKIEMKQKQNRNLVIETLNGGKYKKGNLTETVNVKKVT